MEIFLIRHAQSTNNALPAYQRVEDPALTELGSMQAKLLGNWIGELNLNQVFVSPFLRTLQTAEYIFHATGICPHVRTILHEEGGCYSGHEPGKMWGRPGMTAEEIALKFPDFRFESKIDDRGWWGCRDYENSDEVTARAKDLRQIAKLDVQSTAARIAYVTHANFKLRFLEQFGLDDPAIPWNTSVSSIQFDGTDFQIGHFNQVDHVSDEHLSC